MQHQHLSKLHARNRTPCGRLCCIQTMPRGCVSRCYVVSVMSMARKRSVSGRVRLQTSDDQLVTPRRPSSSGTPIIPLSELETPTDSSQSQQLVPTGRKKQRQKQTTNTKHDSRRGTLVKIRVAPRRQEHSSLLHVRSTLGHLY